ncbi:exodeoxyribonuclease VII large subunit [Eggerthellaceae bacterium zg-1084]|uniref:exodeoxyribonuclease VII large subunit n=1 Tax=Berryella wangjianweii TaxID=2734634 RepID=UPI001556316C|nr:exodeoxyribonuclease VII large subunit [Berryella wangjianweii]NPD31401.1 exodeoxyribonuclease VII large subunit [Berryella wangjianweii]
MSSAASNPPSEGRPQAISVSEAVGLADSALRSFRVTVIGEVSECSIRPGYKAAYFSVKDDGATMPCMMWNGRYEASGVTLQVGALVQMTGTFGVWRNKGRMQFEVASLSLAGEGQLRQRVAQLAERLRAEGLMDQARKRPIPTYPQIIGVVTSPRGAAVHDVLRTLKRRFPVARIVLGGVPVEGEHAPRYLMQGMKAVVDGGAEVVLLVRGGGSYEDLMPFNDESLARTVSRCPVPVVTGIGHEPDTSIADLVADARASTPTAAAEAVSPARDQLEALFAQRGQELERRVSTQVSMMREQLAAREGRPLFRDPQQLFAGDALTLDYAADRMARASGARVGSLGTELTSLNHRLRAQGPRISGERAASLAHAGGRLRRAIPLNVERDAVAVRAYAARLPQGLRGLMAGRADRLDVAGARMGREWRRLLAARAEEVSSRHARLRDAGASRLDACERQMGLAAARLNALSPLAVLGRGYALARDARGGVVKSTDQVSVGDALEVMVSDGRIACVVSDVMDEVAAKAPRGKGA